MVEGEPRWRDVVACALTIERIRLLIGLGPALLGATEGGRAFLAAPPRTWARDVSDEPCVYGDGNVIPLIQAALALVPPVVRWTVLGEVAFLSVRSSAAWTGSSSFVDRMGRRKRQIVVMGPDVTLELALHEIAHAWLAGPPREHSILITAAGEAGLVTLAREEGWLDRVEAHVSREERLAGALAYVWLNEPGARCLPA